MFVECAERELTPPGGAAMNVDNDMHGPVGRIVPTDVAEFKSNRERI
jgi:hypothetical protein